MHCLLGLGCWIGAESSVHDGVSRKKIAVVGFTIPLRQVSAWTRAVHGDVELTLSSPFCAPAGTADQRSSEIAACWRQHGIGRWNAEELKVPLGLQTLPRIALRPLRSLGTLWTLSALRPLRTLWTLRAGRSDGGVERSALARRGL